MSANRLLILSFIACSYSTAVYAQFSADPGGGLIPGPAAHMPPNPFEIPMLTASGERSVGDGGMVLDPSGQPLMPPFPDQRTNRPIAGVVSLHDLEHPIPKKALRDAYEAEKFAEHNKLPKAIAKLQEAIRIDPQYRDAHLNLGVEYARAGRISEARSEFHKALDIGPPCAVIYADLALSSLAVQQLAEAKTMARKALDMDPHNVTAQKIWQYALIH